MWLGLAAAVAAVAVIVVQYGYLPERSGQAGQGREVSPAVDGLSADPAAAAGPAAPTTPPYVRADLVGRQLTLTGTMPGQDLVTEVERSATQLYGPFVVVHSELQVDDTLPREPWLAHAPVAVNLTQMMTDGTVTLAGGRILVGGSTGTEDDVRLLQTRLAEVTGLPVDLGPIEVTGRREPIFVVAGSGDQVTISGVLPDESIREDLINAASIAYGSENVIDTSAADSNVETELWMYRPELFFGILTRFPEYLLRLEGDMFSASLSGGAVFASDSAEISADLRLVLNFGLIILNQDPARTVTIAGHTDDEGSAAYNQTLSQQRADAIARFFVDAGIRPERIIATGKGETEPIDDNSTPEGRDRNRRVEFTVA